MKRLFQTGISVILIAFALSACDKESDDLPRALKAEIEKITDCRCMTFISKYSWRGEIVYFFPSTHIVNVV